MKVLIIGSGGREHTIAWKINQSPMIDTLFVAPGNAGTQAIAKNVNIKADNIEALLSFALDQEIDLTIVGPEVPLVLGITDIFRANGLKIIGPDKKGSRLEGSKAFAKEFMEKYGIKTAKYKEYDDINEAKKDLGLYGYPMVLKADGLAAGKGVLIPESKEEALEALELLMDSDQFGDAGSKIIIEEFLEGTEASVLCFVDGETIIPMETAQDYKRALDGNQGLNTGGMGTYSPSILFDKALSKKVRQEILNPFIKGIKSEKMDFRGILFVGLMIKDSEIKVLEFNVRYGDPETQVILPRLKNDLLDVFLKLESQSLNEVELEWIDEHAVCVVMASGGYPESYEKGFPIKGLNDLDMIFHAGTRNDNGRVLTNGGRVLGVTALGENLKVARQRAYNKVSKISFKDYHYRNDIAKIN